MRKSGLAKLHEWLTTLDARSAKRINPNDTQRVSGSRGVSFWRETYVCLFEEGCQGGDLVILSKICTFDRNRKLLRDHLRERFHRC